MFKKLLIAAAIVATNSTVFANGAPYLGGSMGITNVTGSAGGYYRGVPFTGFAGYGATISHLFYLGGEVFATAGTGTITNSSTVGNMKNSYGYGLSLLPGYLFSDYTMGFVRAGVVRTRFSSMNQTATGGQIGLGMQTNIMQNWDVRGEYTYTGYGKFSGVTPSSDAVSLGIVYKIY